MGYFRWEVMRSMTMRPKSEQKASWFGVALICATTGCSVTVGGSDDDAGTKKKSPSSEGKGDDSKTERADSGGPEESSDDDAGGIERDDSGRDVDAVDAGSNGVGADDEDAGAAVELGRLDCGSIEGARVIEPRGSDNDPTWSGTIYITDSVTVYATPLTIKPGTRIVMAAGARLGITGGTVVAEGTESEPIVFCGREAEAGYWRGLTIDDDVKADSVFKHVAILDGGGGDASAALSVSAEIAIEDVLVENSASAGIAASTLKAGGRGLSLKGNATAAILSGPKAMTNFPLGGVIEDNGEQLVRLAFDQIRSSVVMPNIGVPYLQEDAMLVQEGADFTIEAGVEYRFDVDTGIEIGWNRGDVRWHVNGTEDAPVVFRGQQEGPGGWDGVIIGEKVRTDSSVSFLEVHDAGGNDRYSLATYAALRMNDILLSGNASGAYIGEAGAHDSSSDWTIVDNDGYPLTLEPEALLKLPSASHYAGNELARVRVRKGAIESSGTIPKLDVPFLVLEDLRHSSDGELTIEAGVEFRMAPDSQVTFGWNNARTALFAEGSEDEPIRFIGELEEPGSWIGVNIGTALRSDSKLRWIQFSHAGANGGAALQLASAVDMKNCSFSDNAGDALSQKSSDDTDYSVDNSL